MEYKEILDRSIDRLKESICSLAECSLCLEIKDKYFVDCGYHSFCKKCISGLMNRYRHNKKEKFKHRCPICMKDYDVPVNASAWASKRATNVAKIIGKVQTLTQSIMDTNDIITTAAGSPIPASDEEEWDRIFEEYQQSGSLDDALDIWFDAQVNKLATGRLAGRSAAKVKAHVEAVKARRLSFALDVSCSVTEDAIDRETAPCVDSSIGWAKTLDAFHLNSYQSVSYITLRETTCPATRYNITEWTTEQREAIRSDRMPCNRFKSLVQSLFRSHPLFRSLVFSADQRGVLQEVIADLSSGEESLISRPLELSRKRPLPQLAEDDRGPRNNKNETVQDPARTTAIAATRHEGPSSSSQSAAKLERKDKKDLFDFLPF